jgi:DNA-binding LacI/PurR family transcriptional regulator
MSTKTIKRRPRRADAVTMSDIAARANVSRPTVSIVLNDRHETVGIAPKTRDLVLQVAQEMGYRRNALARAVKTGRSMTLAYLAGDADIEYSALAFSGAMDEAAECDYSIKRFRLYDRPEDNKIIERCSEHRVDGVIVNDTGLAVASDLIRREFEQQDVPVVWLDIKDPQPMGVQIFSDDEHGMREAVEHLVQLGHRRLAYIGGIEGVGTSIPRLNGFKQGLKNAGLKSSLTCWTNWVASRIFEVTDEIMTRSAPPTAILCGSDPIALILMRYLRATGRNVPGDVSVIGFGDLARVELADPALTTIHVPYKEMGREAVRQALAQVEAPETVNKLQNMPFATQLVKRDSTAKAP